VEEYKSTIMRVLAVIILTASFYFIFLFDEQAHDQKLYQSAAASIMLTAYIRCDFSKIQHNEV